MSATGAREGHGVALVLVSAACFGALGIFSQLAYRAGVTVVGLLWGRYLLAATVLWLAVVLGRRARPRGRSIPIGLALGAGYSTQAVLFAESLRHLEAGLADLLYFAYPVVVVVLATLLRRERWSRRRTGAVAAAGAGIVIGVSGGGTVDPAGVTLALLAALGYAGYVLASSALLKGLDPIGLAALLCTGASLLLGGDALANGVAIPGHGPSGLALIVATALLSTVLGIGAFLAGIRGLGPSRASIVSSVEPALTAAFGFAAFGNRFGPVQMLGVALVFGSVLILEVRVPNALRRGRPARRATVRTSRRPRGLQKTWIYRCANALSGG
jgi:drug/metabolite transporter (DMT)-like permease